MVVTGALAGVACALVGTFLLLRQMSMMGDAISHAVLPGLAIGFLVSGTRGGVAMWVGAVLAGVLTALLTEVISRWGRVDRGAAMGVVFTALFAVGLILIVRTADRVDLDPSCVLYGALELTPLDTVRVGWGGEVPVATLRLGVVSLVNLVVILLFYKELRLSAFDPALARALGYPAEALHYLLMVLTAVTTVAAFEAVGSILVIAMLIVPAATAHLVARRLGVMLVVACGLAGLTAWLGHAAAIIIPKWLGYSATSTTGAMAVVGGVIFALVAIGGGFWAMLQRHSAKHQVSLAGA